MIDDEEFRMLYWKSPKMLKHLNFWLDTKEEKHLDEIASYDKGAITNLKRTRNLLKRKNLETVIINCSKPALVKGGFFVVKAIIPELQPFYIEEKYKYLGGRRLYEVPRTLGLRPANTAESLLNKIPHPF